jgi:hypothetical protein
MFSEFTQKFVKNRDLQWKFTKISLSIFRTFTFDLKIIKFTLILRQNGDFTQRKQTLRQVKNVCTQKKFPGPLSQVTFSPV